MKKILLSTAYLPPVSWMFLLSKAEEIIIEQYETYPKQTYRNRCNIVTSQGIQSLIIPVKKVHGNHTLINDIEIDNSTAWQNRHWRAITSAYSKTPYFLFYKDDFEPLIYSGNTSLLRSNLDLLHMLIKIIGFSKCKVSLSSAYERQPEFHDFRNVISPKVRERFIPQSTFPRYIQPFEHLHGFIPDVSIIDLLFNLGPETKHYFEEMDQLAGNIIS